MYWSSVAEATKINRIIIKTKANTNIKLTVPTFDIHFLFIFSQFFGYLACQRFILPTLNPMILLSICNLRQRVWIECHGFCSSVEMSWVDIGLVFF